MMQALSFSLPPATVSAVPASPPTSGAPSALVGTDTAGVAAGGSLPASGLFAQALASADEHLTPTGAMTDGLALKSATEDATLLALKQNGLGSGDPTSVGLDKAIDANRRLASTLESIDLTIDLTNNMSINGLTHVSTEAVLGDATTVDKGKPEEQPAESVMAGVDVNALMMTAALPLVPAVSPAPTASWRATDRAAVGTEGGVASGADTGADRGVARMLSGLASLTASGPEGPGALTLAQVAADRRSSDQRDGRDAHRSALESGARAARGAVGAPKSETLQSTLQPTRESTLQPNLQAPVQAATSSLSPQAAYPPALVAASLAAPNLDASRGTPTPSFETSLRAAVGSPDFAPALGAQVSMLARDGIGHARLNLHPAEFGPIDVQILLDGRRAQVNMSAEHAATRQALEQALPLLASSLRDAGLTLSGGGVFQQSAQGQAWAQEQAEAQQSAGRSATSGTGAANGSEVGAADMVAVSMQRARAQRGAVDLYA